MAITSEILNEFLSNLVELLQITQFLKWCWFKSSKPLFFAHNRFFNCFEAWWIDLSAIFAAFAFLIRYIYTKGLFELFEGLLNFLDFPSLFCFGLFAGRKQQQHQQQLPNW